MHWLENGYKSLQLDIIGFLAILGEASIKTNAQVHQLSWASLLPQLIPAPQALIRTSRPTELKPTPGKVLGSKSGGSRLFVNHIAHLLHSREKLPDYGVRWERIEKPRPEGRVSAAKWGPLTLASLLGSAMSIGLIGLSAKQEDGFGLVATLLLSLLSTMIGVGSRWSLELKQRKAKRSVPPDRIVVNYPNGSFRIIFCSEEVARELYWHPETCNYKLGENVYRFISLVGTLTLMVGVVCLGNAKIDVQVAYGAAYLILNALYWVVAALPPQWHWDLDCYKVTRQHYVGEEDRSTFTTALWKAIAITGSVDWVRNNSVAPVSEGWKKWVDMANDVVWEEETRQKKQEAQSNGSADATFSKPTATKKTLPAWDPEKALDECLHPSAAEDSV